jgi:hypothetical protein
MPDPVITSGLKILPTVRVNVFKTPESSVAGSRSLFEIRFFNAVTKAPVDPTNVKVHVRHMDSDEEDHSFALQKIGTITGFFAGNYMFEEPGNWYCTVTLGSPSTIVDQVIHNVVGRKVE